LKSTLYEEQEKLIRSKKAGEIFNKLRVTHCPVCDQEIIKSTNQDQNCYLCHQPINCRNDSSDRLDFEILQTKSSLSEFEKLLHQYETENEDILKNERLINNDLKSIEYRLIPIRNKLSAITNPEISLIDMKCGQIFEQIENYKRIKKLFDYRIELSNKINEVSSEIHKLKSSYESSLSDIKLEKIRDDFEDGINIYLKQIYKWPSEKIVRVYIDEEYNKIKFKFNKINWENELGATYIGYFLLAYNHSMLSLTGKNGYNYPGFCMIDFPLEFSEKGQDADYVIDPFISLCNNHKPPLQMLIAGVSFSNDNAHILKLTESWI
jgi:hypothetical protein